MTATIRSMSAPNSKVRAGSLIKVLIECKRYGRPVEREKVAVLADKLRALGAHKGMMFSTSGFQKGALTYAQKHGIALVKVEAGSASLLAKGEEIPDSLLATVGSYSAWVLKGDGGDDTGGTMSLLDSDNPGVLAEWVSGLNAPDLE